MIELLDISKIFNQGRPNQFTALSGISLSIPRHRITVLKGPSGSGKSTLLGIIGCMSRPTSGRIRVQLPAGALNPGGEPAIPGGEMTHLPERFLSQVRRRHFGFIFQQFHLIKGLTVIENVMLPALPLGENHTELRERARHLLNLFDISEKEQARVEWLSGGETQRVAIARALINNPEVIIADEPTAHLDSRLSAEFIDILGRLKHEGKTILVASHDPLVCDASLIDLTVPLQDGRLVEGP